MTRTLLALTLAATLSSGASATLYTGDNGTQSATADFVFNGTSSLALTLTNTTTDIQSIVDILDDFHWLFADTSFTMSLNSINVPGGRETCSTTTGPPPHVTTCTNDGNTNGSGTWGLFTSGGQVDMYSNGSQIHPYGIVNSTFMDNAGDGGGLDNAQHNPVLLGAVTFNFTFTGLDSTDLSNVDFTFGTVPLHVPGTCDDCGTTATTATTVPEPMTALLVGTALIGLGLGRRRRLQQ